MFSLSKRSAVVKTPSRSEQVRSLWVEFEVWHSTRLDEIEGKIQVALKDLEQKWRSTKSRRSKKDPKELEEEKTKTRLELEKTLNGNVVRQEWDKRLEGAGLVSEDWVDMTEEEQRKVEMILGADLELEEMPTRISENYAIVDPNTFHSPDDAWLEVKHSLRSVDQLSLDASTTSSASSELWGNAAYNSWSSEASRSSAQSSQTSSPEWHSSKYLASDASSSPSRPSTSASTSASSQYRSKSQYIGPQLVSDSEAEDDEASFEKFRLHTRIKKIREFHEEAAEADIRLTMDLDEARRKKSWSKEEEVRRVRAHEADMLALRDRKEVERKAEVDAERLKRRAELQQQHPIERDLASTTQMLLKTLERDASETPTIRRSAFARNGKQSLQHLHQQDWAESGNDTPTPARSAAWTFKKEKMASGSGATASALAEAPPFRRLATAPASTSMFASSVPDDESSNKASKKRTATKPSSSSLFSSIHDDDSTQLSNAQVAQPKKSSSTAVLPTPVPVPPTSSTSSSKKSKKEKAKIMEKGNAVPTEGTGGSEKRVDETSARMPGQWGWGEDPSFASSPNIEGIWHSDFSAKHSTTAVPSTHWPSSSMASSHLSHLSYPPVTSMSASTSTHVALPSGSTSAIVSATQSHPSQVPDNRRVWLPPSALEANNKNGIKAKGALDSTLDVPTPIQKSVSGPGSSSGQLAGTSGALDVPTLIQKSVSGPPEFGTKVRSTTTTTTTLEGSKGSKEPEKSGHSRVLEPLANGTHKASSKSSSAAPAKADVATPAIVAPPLAKSSSSSSSSSSKKKSKTKKKVTIEEAQDDEESNPVDAEKAKLPVDSRYIMEAIAEPMSPKPVVSQPQSQELYRGIFEFGDGNPTPAPGLPPSSSSDTLRHMHHQQQQQHDVWTPSAPHSGFSPSASVSSSAFPPNDGNDYDSNDHDLWVPGMSQSTKRQDDKQEKRVRWTPNAYAYDAPEQDPEDVFLSALDSLEAIVRGGGGADETASGGDVGGGAKGNGAGKREVGNKKAQNKGRAAPENTDETFWQHAMSSLGRGGNNISAPSAM